MTANHTPTLPTLRQAWPPLFFGDGFSVQSHANAVVVVDLRHVVATLGMAITTSGRLTVGYGLQNMGHVWDCSDRLSTTMTVGNRSVCCVNDVTATDILRMNTVHHTCEKNTTACQLQDPYKSDRAMHSLHIIQHAQSRLLTASMHKSRSVFWLSDSSHWGILALCTTFKPHVFFRP